MTSLALAQNALIFEDGWNNIHVYVWNRDAREHVFFMFFLSHGIVSFHPVIPSRQILFFKLLFGNIFIILSHNVSLWKLRNTSTYKKHIFNEDQHKWFIIQRLITFMFNWKYNIIVVELCCRNERNFRKSKFQNWWRHHSLIAYIVLLRSQFIF